MDEVRVRLRGRLAQRLKAEARRTELTVDQLVRLAVKEDLDRQARNRQRLKEACRQNQGATGAIPPTMNGETID